MTADRPVTPYGPTDAPTAGEPASLERRLSILGLRTSGVVMHTNRTVMLSLGRTGVLRLHQGYAAAPDRVLRAIVRFLNPRVRRALRRAAEREFLAFPAEAYAPPRARAFRAEHARPGDLALLHRLETLHQRFNAQHFGGKLETIPIRLSGRMRSRLGELAVDLRSGRPIDIGLSRRHLTRHPWAEVEHTMLHEMVHQWQAEAGLPVNHGPSFRLKARQVGVLPAAKRTIGRPVCLAARALPDRGSAAPASGGMLVATTAGSGSAPPIREHLQNELLNNYCPIKAAGLSFCGMAE